jgi:hypothetical protein
LQFEKVKLVEFLSIALHNSSKTKSLCSHAPRKSKHQRSRYSERKPLF